MIIFYCLFYITLPPICQADVIIGAMSVEFYVELYPTQPWMVFAVG